MQNVILPKGLRDTHSRLHHVFDPSSRLLFIPVGEIVFPLSTADEGRPVAVEGARCSARSAFCAAQNLWSNRERRAFNSIDRWRGRASERARVERGRKWNGDSSLSGPEVVGRMILVRGRWTVVISLTRIYFATTAEVEAERSPPTSPTANVVGAIR